MSLLLGRPISRVYVKFPGCMLQFFFKFSSFESWDISTSFRVAHGERKKGMGPRNGRCPRRFSAILEIVILTNRRSQFGNLTTDSKKPCNKHENPGMNQPWPFPPPKKKTTAWGKLYQIHPDTTNWSHSLKDPNHPQVCTQGAVAFFWKWWCWFGLRSPVHSTVVWK